MVRICVRGGLLTLSKDIMCVCAGLSTTAAADDVPWLDFTTVGMGVRSVGQVLSHGAYTHAYRETSSASRSTSGWRHMWRLRQQ